MQRTTITILFSAFLVLGACGSGQSADTVSTGTPQATAPSSTHGPSNGAALPTDASLAVVLVGHGAPPNDMPKDQLRAAMTATYAAHSGGGHAHDDGSHAHADDPLQRMLNWPRTPKNDPYFFGVKSIAESLHEQSGQEVFVGFNEFCGPTTDQALEEAIASGAKEIIVLSVMFTPGGSHSESDILASVDAVRKKHPGTNITYAWPYPVDRIGHLLTEQVRDFHGRAQ